MFDTQITVAGRLVADPVLRETNGGAPMITFRIATNRRKQVPGQQGQYEDGPTSYYSVRAFRHLGSNAFLALKKGDPVVVSGSVEISEFDRQDGTKGTSAEITARSIGHDLTWGVTFFRKVQRGSVADGDGHAKQVRAAGDALAGAMAESGGQSFTIDAPPGVDVMTGEVHEGSERAA